MLCFLMYWKVLGRKKMWADEKDHPGHKPSFLAGIRPREMQKKGAKTVRLLLNVWVCDFRAGSVWVTIKYNNSWNWISPETGKHCHFASLGSGTYYGSVRNVRFDFKQWFSSNFGIVLLFSCSVWNKVTQKLKTTAPVLTRISITHTWNHTLSQCSNGASQKDRVAPLPRGAIGTSADDDDGDAQNK